jgi:catechol 2,3-dioxygenase-like lactoylglutathione lyase family enzyme
MAKIIGPDFLALQVRNLEASRTFYTEQLDLELAPQSASNGRTFSFVDPDGYTITVHGAP